MTSVLVAPAARAGDVSVGGETCKPWPLTKVYYRDAVGRAHASPDAPGLAKVVQFTQNGLTAEQVVPPIGWRPEKASNVELRAFGFPPPTNAEQRSRLAAWTRNADPGLCTSPTKAPLQYASNWSGGMNTGRNDYFSATTDPVTVRSYQGSCTTQSSAAIWAGLGGTNNRPLLQAGFRASFAELNVSYAWWEAVGPNNAGGTDGEVLMLNGENGSGNQVSLRIRPGDQVDSWTYYDYTSSPPHANFVVNDITQGIAATAEFLDAAPFYDGTTADYIVERELRTQDGKSFYLQLRHFPTNYVFTSPVSAYQANGNGIYYTNLAHTELDMTSNATAGGTPIANVPTTPTVTAPTLQSHWQSCPNNDPGGVSTDTVENLIP